MLSRRSCLRWGAAALLAPCGVLSAEAGGFSFETVKALAADLAAADFDGSMRPLPKTLAELNYDGYRKIRFKPDHALWRDDGRFSLQFFHLGFLFDRPIAVNLVETGQVKSFDYQREMFDFGGNELGAGLTEIEGFAGFRVHCPINQPDYADEIAVFLGASYFRVLGREQTYGISARALAIDTATEAGEEFPFFRAFWVEKPAPGADVIVISALLDSPGIAGAYRFAIRPGTDTVVDVDTVLYPRRDIAKLGIAPLTSMYLFGENDRTGVDDVRSEVHDSDGLTIHDAHGEWIWRPLVNPTDLTISTFADDPPMGFGLMQRDRAFTSYRDIEANYERRPNLWVDPSDSWGRGRVELIEIPSEREIHDNVVAFWVPEEPVLAGGVLPFGYRLTASLGGPVGSPPGGRVVSTRIGQADPWLENNQDPTRQFIVEFAGGELDVLRPEQDVTGELSTSSGSLSPLIVKAVPQTGFWRAAFTFDPEDAAPADLRCFLRLGDDVLTETWTYRWTAT